MKDLCLCLSLICVGQEKCVRRFIDMKEKWMLMNNNNSLEWNCLYAVIWATNNKKAPNQQSLRYAHLMTFGSGLA
ncbi:hypothetical protein AHF37_12738 [Paragonimus kellicotti]|nr:hypothetical protein AHF37_12738 [Paragonimus kellicotti]